MVGAHYLRYQPIIDKHKTWNVPFYVGEFQASQISDTALSWLLTNFCDQGVSWSGWTYKTINMWGWGMLSVYPEKTKVNLGSDSFATIKERRSQTSQSANWYELTNVKDGWSNGARCGLPDPVNVIGRGGLAGSAVLPGTPRHFDLVGRRVGQALAP